MKNIYILDTSALINDPCAWKRFSDSEVIIPIAVLNELDKVKKQSGEAGRNARVCIKYLDEISDRMDITVGVMVEDNTLLKVDASHIDMSNSTFAGFGDPTYGDSQILACAYSTYISNPSEHVVLISNDINLRVKAKARGLDAASHEANNNSLSDLYNGVCVIPDEEAGLNLQQLGYINPLDYGFFDLHANECVLFEDASNNAIALGRKVSKEKIKLVKKVFPWNISARNKEQTFAMDLIMDPGVDLITLIGKAGTGKSLVALAAALECVVGKKDYSKLIIYRPIQPVGNDIGYLPGTMEEKLAPWFQAIMDNFEVLFSGKHGSDWKKDLEMFQRKGRIEMEAITYIRGRSIPNAIILIDEAQNLTKEEIKTILTRVGENTKIILNGDIDQIDKDDLDAMNNGLTYVIEKFKDSGIAGHITFTQGERSKLATIASDIL